MIAIIVSVSRIWKPREFVWINIVGLHYKKKVIVHRFFSSEVSLTAFGSLRPLFRYRSIPALRFYTDKDVRDVNQKRVRIANL